MLNFIKKFFYKPQIRFVCLLPEVAKTMPITRASKVTFNWFKTAAENFKRQREMADVGVSIKHIARCPGIITISKNGWIQKSYQDIIIATNGDGTSFRWQTPINQAGLKPGHEWVYDYVSQHDDNTIAPYNTLKPDTLRTTIKIQSPWVVYIPKGYYLLFCPIPYPDDNRFTAACGILDGDQGPNFLNVQLFWHCLNSKEIIPAGTPLAQYFLIKKEDITETVAGFSVAEVEDLQLRRMTLESQFLPSYSKLKDIF